MPTTSSPKGILFLAHEASVTGAPTSLLRILNWMKRNTDIAINVALMKGGSLESQFRECGKVFQMSRERELLVDRWPDDSRRKKLGYRLLQYRLQATFRRADIGLVYANSIDTSRSIELFDYLSCPVICHVRELGLSFDYLGPYWLDKMKQRASRYIAVSDAVKKNLVEYGFPESRVELIHGFTPFPPADIFASPQCFSLEVRKELGISPDAFLVCAAGTLDWRKGPEIFVQLARTLLASGRKNYHFVWLGGGPTNSSLLLPFRHDLRTLGIHDRVHFVGTQDPWRYYAACDVFVSTSRMDPFPLVCLEAASMNKPIVCFSGVGGAEELVGEDCGFSVPYCSIEAMAKAVSKLYDDPDGKLKLGGNARKKWEARFEVSKGVRKILPVIDSLMQ